MSFTTSLNNALAVANPAYAQYALTREMYDDYVKNYQPFDKKLLGMTTYDGNTGVAGKMIAEQDKMIPQLFTASQEQQGRDLASYGLAQSPEEQAIANRQTETARALALTDNRNRATQFQGNLNRAIVLGGLS